MRFSKYHALGNDYLVLDPEDLAQPPSPEAIRRICHRNFGIGSDGILFGPSPSPVATFALRVFNPDGTEAEISGNGLRIFSCYLWDRKRVESTPFTVSTAGATVTCSVRPGGRSITVEMGQVSFSSGRIPMTGPEREVLNEEIELDGRAYRFYGANIGNPHCVLLMSEVSPEIAQRLGPLIETHPYFPNHTNVQFLQILDRENIRIEIWERGAGYTLASGSSSTAAAAVAVKMGSVDPQLTVQMPGGELRLEISEDFHTSMTGPATRIGSIEFDLEALLW